MKYDHTWFVEQQIKRRLASPAFYKVWQKVNAKPKLFVQNLIKRMEERGRERRKIERERVREMDGLNYGLRSIYTLLIGLWIEILFTVLSKLFYIWSQSLHQFHTMQEDSFIN